MSKGSGRRPMKVRPSEFARRWEKVFRKPKRRIQRGKPGDSYFGPFGTFVIPPEGPFTVPEIDALMRERWLAGE